MYLVKRMRQCVSEQGILCKPRPRAGKRVSESTIKKVEDFYRQPDISRELPGKKEYKSVLLKNGKREHRQKRLVLGNLREIYAELKKKRRKKWAFRSLRLSVRQSVFWLALPARIQSAFALYTKTSNFNFLERAIKKPSSQTGLSHSTLIMIA